MNRNRFSIKSWPSLARHVGVLLAVVFLEAHPRATVPNTCDWTGAASTLWSNSGNWSTCGGGVPQAGDTINFQPGGANPVNQNDIVGLSVSNFDFFGVGAGGVGYVISGNGVTVTSVVTDQSLNDASAGGAKVTLPITIGGAGVLIKSLSGNVLTVANVNLNGFDPEFTTDGEIHVTGVISGASACEKTGGIVFLEAANTFSGVLTVHAGEVYAQITGALGSAAAGTVLQADTALVLNAMTTAEPIDMGAGAFLSVLQGDSVLTGPVTVASLGASVNVAAGTSFTMNGGVSGAGQLTKIGNGPLTLAGTNTNAGMTVNGGSFFLTGTQGGTITITSGVAGGTGTAASLVANGGTVAPGLSPGLLTMSSSTTFGAASTFAVELNGTTAGSGYDQLRTAGVTLGNASLNIALGFAPAPGTIFRIIDNTSGPVSGTFSGLAEGATVTVAGQAFTLTYKGGDGNDVVLTAAASVPAMSAAVLWGLGLLLTAIGVLALNRSNRKFLPR